MLPSQLSRRALLKGGALGLLSLGITGCSLKDAQDYFGEDIVEGGRLRWSITKPTCINPYSCQESEGTQVIAQIFDPLIRYDFDKGSLVGAAAEKWEMSDDHKEILFQLEPKAVFHDGSPVGAEDFKKSWEHFIIMARKSDFAKSLAYTISAIRGYDELLDGKADSLSGFKVIDELTFRLELSYAFEDFLYVLARPALGPLPHQAFTDPESFLAMPCGNGAFKIREPWDGISDIALDRFDQYYADTSLIDGVDFIVCDTIMDAYTKYLSGAVDVCDIPYGKIDMCIEKRGKSQDGYTIKENQACALGTKPAVSFIAFNNGDEVLSDINLRRAICLSVDRDKLSDAVFEGYCAPATNLVPPTITGYEEGGWAYAKYNKDAALTILDQYYPVEKGSRGFGLVLTIDKSQTQSSVAQALVDDFSAVGIHVDIQELERDEFIQALYTHNYQMALTSWQAEYPIIGNFLYPLFHSESADNIYQFSNAQIDTKLMDVRQADEVKTRVDGYREINHIIADKVPVAPLVYDSLRKMGGPAVRTAYINPSGICNMARVMMNG